MFLRLPRNAVTSSGAELPAAMKVAPATSCESPRPETQPDPVRSRHTHTARRKQTKHRLTLADDLQRRQEIIVTHDGDGQKHVEDDHEVDQDPSVFPLLKREESLGKLRGLWRDAVARVFCKTHRSSLSAPVSSEGFHIH